MAAQSIFALTPCDVLVYGAFGPTEGYDLGTMALGDTQTFADVNRDDEVVTVAVDSQGVVTLSRPTAWNDPDTQSDYYEIIVTPITEPDVGTTVWIENFLFALAGSEDPQLPNITAAFGGTSAVYTGNPDSGGGFSPDPTPAVTVTQGNRIEINYDVTAAVPGGA